MGRFHKIRDEFREWMAKFEALMQQNASGWPFGKLTPTQELPSTRGGSVDDWIRLLFAVWAMYCIGQLIPMPERNFILKFFFSMVLVLVPLARISAALNGYAPPLSLLGRIATGRLLLPRFDRIFVGPLTSVAVGLTFPLLLAPLGVPEDVAIPAAMGLTIAASMMIGPDLRVWRLIGSHRITADFLQANNFVQVK
jgi:hypothetical protein